MNKNPLRLVAASLIALVAHDAAVAASVISASSSMQNLSYRLVDLDPNDGIAPSVSFYTTTWNSPDIGQSATRAMTGVRYGAYRQIQDSNHYDTGTQIAVGDALSPPDLLQVSGNGVARAVSGPQGMSASVDISADVLTDPRNMDGLSINFTANSDVSNYSYGNTSTSFSLTPNTKLIVEGVADSRIQIDASSLKGTSLDTILNNPQGSLNVRRWGLSTFSMAYYDNTAGWVNMWVGASSLSTHVIDHNGVREVDIAPDYPSQDHEVFQAELVNNHNYAITGNYAWMNNTQIEITGSVPEPGTWALMGLGIAGIGMARRRGSRPS